MSNELAITKDLVSEFLSECGYQWDGNIMLANRDIVAKDSHFDGRDNVVRLTYNNRRNIFKLEINHKSFVIYGIDFDNYESLEESVYLQEDLTDKWIMFLVKRYPGDIKFQIEIRKWIAKRIIHAQKRCESECLELEKKIDKIREKCKCEVMTYKEILNEMDKEVKDNPNDRR